MPVAYPVGLPLARIEKTRERPASFDVPGHLRGFAHVEPTGRDTPVSWSCTWTLGQQDAQTFWLWFSEDLEHGVQPFLMDIRTEFGLVEHELQFSFDGLRARALGGSVWEYEATLLSRSLLGVP